MGTYSLETLYARWQKEELTAEMAIGQLIQLLIELELRVRALERRAEPPVPPAESAS